ncbi:MAG: phosphatidylserine/phosphatidylglycerophosphate/cardiolipin synthase family protein [Oligoflexia bacterium]|nr:phosphatidylserine/phosphatidylglycerophosphate/cardiolipin synthase family protein [Oligoflexia bacterium]MBF0364512.1 phosphatidylserine/phosphatidylglycerophosphate/cardiolipin synthase family protein [Oligoflexia bacterium]
MDIRKVRSMLLLLLISSSVAAVAPVMAIEGAVESGANKTNVLPGSTNDDGSWGGWFENLFSDGLYGTLSALNSIGLLRPVVSPVVSIVGSQTTLLGPPTPELLGEVTNRAINMFDVELADGEKRKNWEQLDKEFKEKIFIGPNHSATKISSPAFKQELESLGQACFVKGNTAKLLVDGPESFKRRYELIDSAKKQIYIMAWAIDNDETGKKYAAHLAAAARKGVEVKVMLDGNVFTRNKHLETIEMMKASGVQFIPWKSPVHGAYGMHSKLMVVDGKSFITGGMNMGNCYSHAYEAVPDWRNWVDPNHYGCWRDTDVEIAGPAASLAIDAFAKLWNGQKPTEEAKVTTERCEDNGTCDVAMISHLPGPKGDNNILGMYLKAIYGAEKQIDIENAYYVTMKPIQEALIDAVKRGVKVRLFTNSDKSADEAMVAAPIIASLPPLIDAGVEVYLRKGTTMHSKFMIIDDEFTTIGSYNLNPRSEHIDTELNAVVFDKNFAENTRKVFDIDISPEKATKITKVEELPQDIFSFSSRFAARHFYEHL